MALTLTKAGKSLLQKIQVGEIEVIDFTGIAVGSGRWNTEDINDNISALKEMKIKNGLSNKQTEVRDNETIVTISATLNNKEIEEAFYVYEVGLYAMDGDEEVLYAFDITPSNEIAQAVIQANTVPQYIPVILDTALSSIDKVNIKITADVGFVSADQFENYKQDIKRQLDGKQPSGDYATTEALTSGLSNKSDKNHNHDEEYLKQEKATELFAEKSHNHDDAYSKANHTHTGYAASSHNHDTVYLKSATAASQYAAKSHTHSNYSTTNHTHTGYAASSHSHAFSAITGSMAITDKRLTGNLPISRVNGAAGKPTITVTDSAKWIEIPLNNGEVLLYGYGVVTENQTGSHNIALPKTVKQLGEYNILNKRIACYGHVTITAGFVGLGFTQYYSAACISNNGFILAPAYEANGNLNGCTWEYVGILA